MSDVDDERVDEEVEEDQEDREARGNGVNDEEGEEGEEGDVSAGAAPAAAAEDEELPDEKPFDGDAKMLMPNGRECVVRFGSGLPAWLPYLVADDFFYFNRTIRGTGASGRGASGGAGGGDAEGDGAAAEGEDPTGDAAGGGEGGDSDAAAFDANTMFALELIDDEAMIYSASVYVPPVPSGGDEDGEGGGGGSGGGGGGSAPAEASTGAPRDEGDAEEGEEGDEGGQRSMASAENTARAAAAKAADDADEAEAEVVIVDALTLAAVFSADVLNVCLSQPNLATKTLADFCAATVGHRSVIIDNLVAAQAKAHEKVASEAKRRKVTMDFSWIWVRQTLPGGVGDALLPTMRSYVQRLIAAKVVPAGGIGAPLLTTAAAVRSYIYLLWLMPKSTLKAITAAAPTEDEPAPPADEEDEGGDATKRKCVAAFLGGLLLDVRRRLARRKAGKRDLRVTPADSQGPLFPAKLEDAFDIVVADSYGARDYEPTPLVLRASDLALLMLAMAPTEFTSDSFQRLLKLKFGIARAPDSNSGLHHLLLHSISEVTEPAAKAIILSTPPRVLEPRGAVDLLQLVDAVPEGFFNYSELFAKQFWVEINDKPQVLASIGAKHPKLHAAVKECEKHHTVMLHSIGENKITTDAFKKYETTFLNEAATCNPYVLHVAVDARNETIMRYLIVEKKVTSVSESPKRGSKEVSVLERALQLDDVALVDFLIGLGFLLNDTFDNGRFSALSFIVDNWRNEETGEISTAVQMVIDHFKAIENDRATDPDLKYGLMRAVPLKV